MKTLIAVWRQALVDKAEVVKLGSARYPITGSKAKRLRQVAFVVDGNTIMEIEQIRRRNRAGLNWLVRAKR
jgi:hypothetical protein